MAVARAGPEHPHSVGGNVAFFHQAGQSAAANCPSVVLARYHPFNNVLLVEAGRGLSFLEECAGS